MRHSASMSQTYPFQHQSITHVIHGRLLGDAGRGYDSHEGMCSIMNYFSTLRPRQNDRQFPDIFKCIFLNENV